MRCRSHLCVPAVAAAGVHDFFGIGGNQDFRKKRRRAHSFVDDADERLACNLAQHFARQTRRGQTSWNNGDRFHEVYFYPRRNGARPQPPSRKWAPMIMAESISGLMRRSLTNSAAAHKIKSWT